MVKELTLNKGFVALVDDDDFPEVRRFRWYVTESQGKSVIRRYALRHVEVDGRRFTIYLHRLLMNAPKGVPVDHKNRDGLDCRRENMRLATPSQNSANRGYTPLNTTGFKGVERARNRWRAVVCKDRRRIRSAHFDTAEEAAREYDRMAVEVHGEFAQLNFPERRAA